MDIAPICPKTPRQEFLNETLYRMDLKRQCVLKRVATNIM